MELSNPTARIVLHDEPPLSEPPLRRPPPPSLLADLLAAESGAQRRRTVAAMLHTIGFDWLAYGRLASFAGQVRPVSLCIAHADARWAQRYCAEAHYEVDPRLHDALQSSLPCSWTLDELHQRSRAAPPQSPLRRFVSDLADTGMRSGAMLVLPGADRNERHLVSLLSRGAGHDWTDDALLGRVLMLGMCLHEFYTRYSGLPPAPGPAGTLTPVQREILDQVARGASDKQIAYDLQLSSHAVDYHMRQLRRRFAVRNRVQLTQAAQIGADS